MTKADLVIAHNEDYNRGYAKANADLEKENAELRNNGFTVSAMTEQQLKVAIEKGEQLEKENKQLKTQLEEVKANADYQIEGRDIKIKELELELTVEKDQHQEEIELHLHAEEYIKSLEQQIEKMKRHCNCKHRDSEGYCEVKRTYLMDLSYDGCDKWELED